MQAGVTLIASARIAAEVLRPWGVVAVLASTALAVRADEGLRLEQVGTEKVYFAYRGKPLLSFGGLSDFMFYATRDAYDYVGWADWAKAHSINHVRAYPPLSWKRMEHFSRKNGGSVEKLLFPYEETKPGSRQFDLTKFNDAYWRHFRQQLEYLQAKGIIVHLLMWNGWQLRADDSWLSSLKQLVGQLRANGSSRDPSDVDWAGHFFNPDNNVNAFTNHLGGVLENRFRIYHSVADKQEGLAKAQKAWFAKLMETTAGLDNVYYDLVHELAGHYRDWDKTQLWVEDMAMAVRAEGARLSPGRSMLLGMDTGGLSEEQRDWIFTRPYFDLLIYGWRHTVGNAVGWRIKYKKPYIPQESWDDNGFKWSYYHPNHRVHLRKYLWKSMMAKSQQLDCYVKRQLNRQAKGAVSPPRYPHNYNPNGWNKFEDDAVILARFWDSLVDYPNLWFNGSIESGPGTHRYVLSSEEEAVAYCSSSTNQEEVKFEAATLKLKGLSLANGAYTVEIIRPDLGVVDKKSITAKDGSASVELPAFVDDLAVHFVRR
jgi:hypothetical protein